MRHDGANGGALVLCDEHDQAYIDEARKKPPKNGSQPNTTRGAEAETAEAERVRAANLRDA